MTKDEARENLEKAIQEYIECIDSYQEDPGLLMDWVLVTAHHIADEEGEGTANGIYTGKSQPLYRTAGLVQYALVKVDRGFRGEV